MNLSISLTSFFYGHYNYKIKHFSNNFFYGNFLWSIVLPCQEIELENFSMLNFILELFSNNLYDKIEYQISVTLVFYVIWLIIIKRVTHITRKKQGRKEMPIIVTLNLGTI